SGAAGSFSSRLLQQARELGAVARSGSSPKLQCRAVLRVLVHGTVSWPGAEGLLCPGALIVDFGPFLPSWYSWRPNSKDPTILSKSFMASAEIDQEFIDRLGAPFMLAAERAASFFIATKSPTLRSVSDVAMMVQYLRRTFLLSVVDPERLNSGMSDGMSSVKPRQSSIVGVRSSRRFKAWQCTRCLKLKNCFSESF
ncbi:unnamed protein product, partial [Symbiodinium necroappetens]